ncbi:ABC transporter permease [Clostridium sp. Marseille-P299]|uniref:ABC transporter permease n=1 Tax=Clostridium sp. Marseille-P299 TaxID=1805477 RepID=UPI000831349A|nr:ABC transporter permease [Clostridium sp. Marseille-P299]
MKYILKRLMIAIPVLIGITIVDFLLMNLAPGNPLDMMRNPFVSDTALELKEQALGLNQPLYIQYFTWLKELLHGNLGYSVITYQPVAKLIASHIGPTLLLMGVSLFFGLLIAIPVGVISATKQYSKTDYAVVSASFLGISIPSFFLAMLFIYIFTVKLKWLPSSGMVTLGGKGDFVDILKHIIQPALVLTIAVAGRNIRYIRSSMLEILDQEYLRTAKGKGLRNFLVVNKHAMRNALIPIVTVIGMEIPVVFGGAVVIEQIFSWPGIGLLTMSSIMSRDYPTIMGLNLVAAIIVLLANLLTDIAYGLVNPRIKLK